MRYLIKLICLFIPSKKLRVWIRNIIPNRNIKKVVKVSEDILRKIDEDGLIKKSELSKENPKIVWQCWFQGQENAPLIVRECIDSVKKFTNGYRHVLITDDNISDFVEMPDFIIEKFKKGYISKTHFSDILRVCLLSKYGGIWIDATVLLTGQIPKNIEESDFFVFKNPDHNLTKILISNWFILSKPNHPLVNMIKEALFFYWKQNSRMIDYFMFHYLFSVGVKKNLLCKKLFDNIPFSSNKAPHDLQHLLGSESKISDCENMCDKIAKESSIHKLTYKGERVSLAFNELNHIFNNK
jgi:hypothetical protein